MGFYIVADVTLVVWEYYINLTRLNGKLAKYINGDF